MKNQRAPLNQTEKLNQRIIDNYHSLKKRHTLFTLILLIIMIATGFGLGNFFLTQDQFTNKIAGYEKKIKPLQQERADILSGKIEAPTKSFDDVLTENLAGLKDYPQREDNYQVKIKGTDSTLTINRNNVFVADNAGILNQATKRKIYDLNKELAASTNGAQLEVVTVKELPSGEDIESYANTVFNQLGIGDKTADNGVLYLVALEDKEFRLEVGYGLEGLIPDGKADDIINNDDVVENFKDENYSQGVTQVVEEVFKLMNTKTALVDSKIQQLEDQKSSATLAHWGLLAGLLIVGMIALVLLVNLLRAKGFLRRTYQNYLDQTQAVIGRKAFSTDQEQENPLKQTELYYLMLSGIFLGLTVNGLKRSIKQGALLKNPQAKKMGLGRVLIGDTLYSGNGDILTTAYLASNYNSKNWSNNDTSSGGGGSWGSFGGGSSGGGGASGGW